MVPYGAEYKIQEFIRRSADTAYREEPSELHTQISNDVWNNILTLTGLQPGAKILDIGCGCGVGIEMFVRSLMKPIGITCVQSEFEEIEAKFPGTAILLDMHDVGIFEQYADLTWARHVLEHSVAPSFMLAEIFRATKSGGFLYVETPGCDTSSQHETNPSHYSVLTRTMWENLFSRAGFNLITKGTIDFRTGLGQDQYYYWLLKKP